ncbi:MAG: SDR family NAD(P)-dependent oxidoreductase [Candidatus Pacebacteria bacterium]|jgi:hypothetical protein|nr:SDR family NAD(P)-dependent oxidoreductase [Candidatus Paceibacterota bacterium]
MKTKTALITGATGGIGGAIARALLAKGYTIYALVRGDIARAHSMFAEHPNIVFSQCVLTDSESVYESIRKWHNAGIVFNHVYLVAGRFAWDHTFPGETPEQKRQSAIVALNLDNYLTKETVIDALLDLYGIHCAQMLVTFIASQAADFKDDDPRRVNEEGYVQSMIRVTEFGLLLKKLGTFMDIVIEKPPLVNTNGVRDKFTEQTIGKNPSWDNPSEVLQPDQYAEVVLSRSLA